MYKKLIVFCFLMIIYYDLFQIIFQSVAHHDYFSAIILKQNKQKNGIRKVLRALREA